MQALQKQQKIWGQFDLWL